MQQNPGQVKLFRNSILKYLLVVLFISYYAGGIAFTHVHHFPTYTIIHSHPYLPGQDGQPLHEHSSAAFETINLLNDIILEETPVLAFSIAWVLLATFLLQNIYNSVFRIIRHRNLRAPPVFI